MSRMERAIEPDTNVAGKEHTMIVQCKDCQKWYEDVYRSTECPHSTFNANDGYNKFAHHPLSYLSDVEPPMDRVFEAHRDDKAK